MSGDRSCAWPDGSMFVWEEYQWGIESKIVLFRPLGLGLHKVPNLQTQNTHIASAKVLCLVHVVVQGLGFGM